MTTIRIALVAALVAVAGNAAAQDTGLAPQSYLHLRLGGILAQSSDLKDTDIENGFDGEVAIGRRFGPNFAAELGVGYFSAEGRTSSVFDPGSGLTIDVTPKFSGVPLTASAKGIMPLGPSAEVYGLVGLGLYRVTLEATGSALGQTASTSDDDSAFGFLIGGGISFDVTPKVFLSADLRYLVAKATFFGGEGNIDSLFLNAGIGTRF